MLCADFYSRMRDREGYATQRIVGAIDYPHPPRYCAPIIRQARCLEDQHARVYVPGNVRDCRQERPLLRQRWAKAGSDSRAHTHSGAWRMTGQLKRALAQGRMRSPPEGRKPEYPEEPCVPRARKKVESKFSANQCLVF